MKALRKLIGASALVLASASSSAVETGGVTWDPGASSDFNLAYNFQQWFETGLDTGNFADILANPIPGPVDGDFLRGVGDVYEINNQPVDVCATCELTFAFGGLELQVDDLGTLEFSTFDEASAWVNTPGNTGSIGVANGNPAVIGATSAYYLTGQSYFRIYHQDHGGNADEQYDESILAGMNNSDDIKDELADAGAGVGTTVWLEGVFDVATLIAGNFGNGSLAYILNLTGGDAFNNFVDNGFNIPMTAIFVDILGDGQASGNNQDSASAINPNIFYTSSGNGQFNADSIPEPTSLAIFGLAIMGLAAGARRKQSK